MNRAPNRLTFFVLFALGLALGIFPRLAAARADSATRLGTDPRPAAAVQAFLYPPYPGTSSQESVFDHSAPNYTDSDGRIVFFNGGEARKTCPNPPPPGTPPAQAGVCDAGYGTYWSYSLGDWVSYNGHDGIDFGLSYRPLYAAANADQVIFAGWYNPQNHKQNLGIYVKLHHANGYTTAYGHMSSVALQSCATVGCANIPRGEVLGTSGNTGNSTGPHLHLLVRDPSGRSVDPYGWSGSGADPLSYNQPESLWVQFPSLTFYGAQIYPNGAALEYPPSVATGILVDDGGIGFSESPTACWTLASAGSAETNSMRWSKPRNSASNCNATWQFPLGAAPGQYAVYVRIPAIHATTEGALYKITHAGRSDQIVLNQVVFPNGFYASDGWIYIGKYAFTGDGTESVNLGNQTQDQSTDLPNLQVGADAVRFVYVTDVTITPPPSFTPTSTLTKTPTATATTTRTLTNTSTPTMTRTATKTLTPTITRSPTSTRTPTPTGSATSTRTATLTATSTKTPLPTATPIWTLVKVYFADKNRLASNILPIEVNGVRWVKSAPFMGADTLNEYFKGPGYTELGWGYVGVYNGFTGYTKIELLASTAHVYLKGFCVPSGSAFTIADLINLNLKQFPTVTAVKIYDQLGQTRDPGGSGDSEPLCLDPAFVPSSTPSISPTPSKTLTPTRTPSPTITPSPTRSPTPTQTPSKTRTPILTPTISRTPRPTDTRQPTATPPYTLLKVYFVDNVRYLAGTPPYEVNGVRYAASNVNFAQFVLDEYFKGPGYTEYYTYKWRALYNGFTGYSKLELRDGGAYVYLKGVCDRAGATYTIADLLKLNLKQLSTIGFVKVFDENGTTQTPTGAMDSIPACLQP